MKATPARDAALADTASTKSRCPDGVRAGERREVARAQLLLGERVSSDPVSLLLARFS